MNKHTDKKSERAGYKPSQKPSDDSDPDQLRENLRELNDGLEKKSNPYDLGDQRVSYEMPKGDSDAYASVRELGRENMKRENQTCINTQRTEDKKRTEYLTKLLEIGYQLSKSEGSPSKLLNILSKLEEDYPLLTREYNKYFTNLEQLTMLRFEEY